MKANKPSADGDRSRATDLAWASLGAALGLGLALCAARADATSASPGPLSRPHVAANLACGDCHGAGADASPTRACVRCHDAAKHASTRPGHRALASRGALGCVGCHDAHGDAQGVSLEENGHFVRFGGAATSAGDLGHPTAKATVPLVSGAHCTPCHHTADVADPASRCFPRGATASVCFDEHLDPTSEAWGSAARVRAWGGAREVAMATPSVRGGAADWRPITWTVAPALSALALVIGARAVRSKRKKVPPPRPAIEPTKRRLPQIDATTCLGCYACVEVCPFDVIEVRDFVARVVRPDDCCGVVACQEACPNGSLTIADGGEKKGVPRVNAQLECEGQPGLFLAGDLTGMPLIRNAIEQAASVVDTIASRRERKGDPLDLVIVGAGPAGLSAALRSKEKKLRFEVLEQSTVASSIKGFPRGKLVLDAAVNVPLEGPLWFAETTKEELLREWSRILRRHAIEVREGERVLSATREGDAFEVRTSKGRTVRARHVLLAIGRRGTPRALPFPVRAGAEGMVSRALADARSFAGKRVLVVGLGDAAMEAAVALAAQPGTSVVVSYRGAGFSRGKARNIEALEACVARGQVKLELESTVIEARAGGAVLRTPRGEESIDVDAILALLGGAPSAELLTACGVELG